MPSGYYDFNDKLVIDGDKANASDLNNVNIAADSAFQQIEFDLVDIGVISEAWAGVSEAWADTDEDIVVPGEVDKYSSKHHRLKAEDAQIAAETAESNALVSETNAATSESNALSSETNAAASEANALTSKNDAAISAASASNSANTAILEQWEAEAEKMTADSYATEAEDVFVNVYTSDGDGTFTATPTTEYSSLHWAAKSNGYAGVPNDDSVSTIKIQDDAVTNAKIATGAVNADSIAANSVGVSEMQDHAIGMNELSDTTIEAANTRRRVAKAWINFNGNTNAIRSDFNVSSITDLGVGRWRVNFSASMGNTNYAVLASGDYKNDTLATSIHFHTYAANAAYATITGALSGTYFDCDTITLVVFNL